MADVCRGHAGMGKVGLVG